MVFCCHTNLANFTVLYIKGNVWQFFENKDDNMVFHSVPWISLVLMDFDKGSIWNIEDEIVFPLQKHIYRWLVDHKKHTRHLIMKHFNTNHSSSKGVFIKLTTRLRDIRPPKIPKRVNPYLFVEDNAFRSMVFHLIRRILLCQMGHNQVLDKQNI